MRIAMTHNLRFTDAEEEGLLGAHAFVTTHPWAAGVGAVLNFEARGNAGAVLMFQTGNDSGGLVRELGRLPDRPAANSLSRALYQRMPNDTDLSEWLPRTPALDFANIGGFARYHAPTDTVENASLGTLQQHGAAALGLARALATRRLPLPSEPDPVYFDAGPFFVRYPGTAERRDVRFLPSCARAGPSPGWGRDRGARERARHLLRDRG